MKKLSHLVNPDILRNINTQDRLSNAVYERLNLDKKTHKIWVIIKQQQLTLVTDHPILASQLQYQKQMISEYLNRRFLLQIKTTQIKISPPQMIRNNKKKQRFVISKQTSSILKGIAMLIDDGDLKNSLINLGKTTKDTN